MPAAPSAPVDWDSCTITFAVTRTFLYHAIEERGDFENLTSRRRTSRSFDIRREKNRKTAGSATTSKRCRAAQSCAHRAASPAYRQEGTAGSRATVLGGRRVLRVRDESENRRVAREALALLAQPPKRKRSSHLSVGRAWNRVRGRSRSNIPPNVEPRAARDQACDHRLAAENTVTATKSPSDLA